MPKKILIADDDVNLVKVVADRLRAAGYDVATAGEADQAIEAARAERPDLILMDINMPAGGGYAVLDNLRKFPETSHIPVIIFSGQDPEEIIKKTVENLRVADYIFKPFRSEELLTKIRRVLEGSADKK
jgi:DNA-binding response OmpR family regulator